MINKQEVIEKLKKQLILNSEIVGSEFDKGYNYAIKIAIAAVVELDEPEKPIVPQFVADWYETNKYSLELNIYTLCIRSYQNELTEKEFAKWFDDVRNKAIETLVKMKVYGYEVEKEKLYTVEIPNPNGGTYLALCKDVDGKLFFDVFFGEEWKTFGKCKLTESEIKKDYAWAWQFAKEVEE